MHLYTQYIYSYQCYQCTETVNFTGNSINTNYSGHLLLHYDLYYFNYNNIMDNMYQYVMPTNISVGL